MQINYLALLFVTKHKKFVPSSFLNKTCQYIHHEPLDQSDLIEVAKVTELYDYTLNVYSKIFKEIDEQWWPDSSEGIDHGPVVCRHMMVTDQEIWKASPFEKRQGVTPIHCGNA